MKYKCTVCGHIYDEEKTGVKFADLPDDWKCPLCKQPKSKFEPVNEQLNCPGLPSTRSASLPIWQKT